MGGALDTRRWLVSAGRRSGAPRLYLFPHGGGAAAEYVRWARDLPGIEAHAVQLPGRGTRLREPALTGMRPLVAAMVEQIPFGARGFAFFGHSLGALVAYEVTKALRVAGKPLPDRLIVSGFRAPSQPREIVPVHQLGDDELIAEVNRRHGGFPAEVLADADLRAMLAGYLRADYQVLETYEYRETTPLPVPITAFGGRSDAVSVADLEAWGRHTVWPVGVRLFDGGHFYLRDHGPAVRRAIASVLHGNEQRKAA
jgi:surfactin synthase thioesterase subunit